jgi:hypothetical protein
MPFNTKEKRDAYNKRYYREHREEQIKATLDYQKDHPKGVNRKNRRNYRKLRLKIVKILGSKCSKCRFDDWRALQIDHVNGDGVKERKKYTSWYYYKHILKEIQNGSKKYQLLCANCNCIKRYENKEYKDYIKGIGWVG